MGESTSSAAYEFRANQHTYLLLSFLLSIPLVMLMTGYLFEINLVLSLIIILLCAVPFYVWLKSHCIRVARHKLSYSRLFHRTVSIPYPEINKVSVEYPHNVQQAMLFSRARVIIEPTAASARQKLVINAKVFQRPAIDAFIALLGEEMAKRN